MIKRRRYDSNNSRDQKDRKIEHSSQKGRYSRKYVIISFSVRTSQFISLGERNMFFRELYGYKQVVKRGDKRYCYQRSGILDKIPHFKIDDSVFMIPESGLKEIIKYFNRWRRKVEYKVIRVMLNEKRLIEYFEGE
jgi:hypothetical protein